jgi:hypothetical protein
LVRLAVSSIPNHPDTLTAMHNLAYAHRGAGQLDKAVSLYEQVLAKRKAKLGPDHSSSPPGRHPGRPSPSGPGVPLSSGFGRGVHGFLDQQRGPVRLGVHCAPG